jgi:HK97 gp10 family phage protein
MAKSGIEIKGLKELQKKLKKLGEDISAEMEEALAAGAEIISADAIEKLKPYIYKTMGGRKAIHIEKVYQGTKVADVIVGVDPDYILYLPRGESELKWVMFGKSGFIPYPFLRKSFDENKARVLDTIQNELKKTIAKATK